jgi:sugar lactone lactonase YvrE
MRYDGEALTKLADVSHLSGGKLNDMVVDQFGHIYMSNLGYDYEKGEERVTTNIVRVDADGSSQAATPGVLCPNGMAITADGKTLIVGQSASAEVLGFDLAKDGTVSNRQVYAELPEGRIADGICVDAEGAVWVASPITKEFVRIKKGGEVTDIISTGERHAIACMLGGEDRKTLFCMTSAGIHLSASPEVLEGAIEIATVDVPGAGWP